MSVYTIEAIFDVPWPDFRIYCTVLGGLGMVLYISEGVCSIYTEIYLRITLFNTTSWTHADEARLRLVSSVVLSTPWTLNAWVCEK